MRPAQGERTCYQTAKEYRVDYEKESWCLLLADDESDKVEVSGHS